MALTRERMMLVERPKNAEVRALRAVQELDRNPRARTELERAKTDAAAAEREAQALLAMWRPG